MLDRDRGLLRFQIAHERVEVAADGVVDTSDVAPLDGQAGEGGNHALGHGAHIVQVFPLGVAEVFLDDQPAVLDHQHAEKPVVGAGAFQTLLHHVGGASHLVDRRGGPRLCQIDVRRPGELRYHRLAAARAKGGARRSTARGEQSRRAWSGNRGRALPGEPEGDARRRSPMWCTCLKTQSVHASRRAPAWAPRRVAPGAGCRR